jgi:hypothetical protein
MERNLECQRQGRLAVSSYPLANAWYESRIDEEENSGQDEHEDTGHANGEDGLANGDDYGADQARRNAEPN